MLVYIYNDHMTAFFDHYSYFALGVGEGFGPADEGGGPRAIPAIKGDPEFAAHAMVMVADEFDLSYFQGKNLDHGAFSPLSVMVDHDDGLGLPARLLPVRLRRAHRAAARARRFYEVRREPAPGDQSYPQGHQGGKIAGTGGLSHQVHGEKLPGSITPSGTWNSWTGVEKDPESLLDLAQFAGQGGTGGWESAEGGDALADDARRSVVEEVEVAVRPTSCRR